MSKSKDVAYAAIKEKIVPGDLKSLAQLIDGANHAITIMGERNKTKLDDIEARISASGGGEAGKAAVMEGVDLLIHDTTYLHGVAELLRKGLSLWLYTDLETMLLDKLELIKDEVQKGDS
jgi:hypothetical protein